MFIFLYTYSLNFYVLAQKMASRWTSVSFFVEVLPSAYLTYIMWSVLAFLGPPQKSLLFFFWVKNTLAMLLEVGLYENHVEKTTSAKSVGSTESTFIKRYNFSHRSFSIIDQHLRVLVEITHRLHIAATRERWVASLTRLARYFHLQTLLLFWTANSSQNVKNIVLAFAWLIIAHTKMRF